MSNKLTKRFVESITPLDGRELLVWDSEIKGLGLRVFPSGRRTYFVQYRNQSNRTRRQKIGVHGIVTADQARAEAIKILSDVIKGDDPSSERKVLKSALLFSELAKDYLDIYAKATKSPQSYFEDKRYIKSCLLKVFGTKLVSEITTKDIQSLHNGFQDKVYKANRIHSLLNKMFNLSVEWGLRADNPAKGIKKYQEHKRTRWLAQEEMDRLWRVLDSYQDQKIANVFRLLLLTGSRKGEVLNATWDQFDLEKGVWTKPAHTTKQKRMEHVPLSSQATDLLKHVKAISSEGPYLFPGKVEGQPLKEIKKSWATIRKQADIEDVRIHDLRHTYASHLVSSGLSLSIVGKLLGHTQTSTTQRYAHLADEPLREATEMFAKKIGRVSK